MRRFLGVLRPLLQQLSNANGKFLPAVAVPVPVPVPIAANITRRPVIACASSGRSGSRFYCQQTASGVAQTTVECWNCKKQTELEHHMICSHCGHLQDVDERINYFDLLNYPKTFLVKTHDLTKQFRQLQTLVHPDKYSTRSSREKNNSADWSSLVNKAYKTLSIPIERGKYILSLHGETIPEANTALDKEFLMEMMEQNEAVEQATKPAELEQLYDKIVEQINEQLQELSQYFEKNALDSAKAILIKLKYLINIQQTIKQKLQDVLAG